MAKYLHRSMAGSFWIPCKVLGSPTDLDEIQISFYDFVIDKHVKQTVEGVHVKLSKRDRDAMALLPMSPPPPETILELVRKMLAARTQATSE